MKIHRLILISLICISIYSCGEIRDNSRLVEEHQLERADYADSVNRGLVEDTFKGSARREASAKIGETEVMINYGSPGKRGRVIWNGLVSYDQVWVSGSHWATAVTFSKAVEVAGQKIETGTYGFFTIPGQERWVLIINQNYDQHLADAYDEQENVVTLIVTPENLNQEVQRLTYEVTATSDNKGEISLSWDQTKVSLPFQTL